MSRKLPHEAMEDGAALEERGRQMADHVNTGPQKSRGDQRVTQRLGHQLKVA